ncbi:MAG: Gfo/Idh/MocA family oxidoreductase [Candidatus Pacebacteria bacterium]|nr:Gfo/Idh/MocA family oxidoreductase [Candidatus Paceibacterota bacterium]
MSKQNTYKAAIIGAGRIASGYDSLESPKILTHAHAYKKHGNVELLGFYDTDAGKAEQAAKKWSAGFFGDLIELDAAAPEIISVCVPDGEHSGVLKKIAGFKNKPKIVICEKPITAEIKDTEEVIKLYEDKKIPLLIDHTQRFNPTAREAAEKIKNGEYGKVVCASAVYSNGVLHGGTHVLDLARYFFGEVESFKVLYKIKDREGEDMTVGAFLEFENCPQFYFMTDDERNYSYSRFDIVCEKGRVSFPDFWFTLTEQKVVSDPVYKGDRILSEPIIQKTKFDEALLYLISNAINHIESGEALLSSGEDAAKTQKACHDLLNEALK